MAFHAGQQKVYLFGGLGANSGMWTWDGIAWTRFTAATPPTRVVHAMEYDATRNTLIIFGGYDGVRNLGDTWEMIGERWVEVWSAAAMPPL